MKTCKERDHTDNNIETTDEGNTCYLYPINSIDTSS